MKLFIWSKQSHAGNKIFNVAISNWHRLEMSRAANETLHLNRCMNCFKVCVGISKKTVYHVKLDGFVSSPLDSLYLMKCS